MFIAQLEVILMGFCFETGTYVLNLMLEDLKKCCTEWYFCIAAFENLFQIVIVYINKRTKEGSLTYGNAR